MGTLGVNAEVTTFTQALYEARELAMARMQAGAEQLDAEGIVGVRLKNLAHTVDRAHHRILRCRHRRAPVA
jgi:uncharacterized protein YbjQ (UPF0145 family)